MAETTLGGSEICEILAMRSSDRLSIRSGVITTPGLGFSFSLDPEDVRL
jgi:hypothetical protein